MTQGLNNFHAFQDSRAARISGRSIPSGRQRIVHDDIYKTWLPVAETPCGSICSKRQTSYIIETVINFWCMLSAVRGLPLCASPVFWSKCGQTEWCDASCSGMQIGESWAHLSNPRYFRSCVIAIVPIKFGKRIARNISFKHFIGHFSRHCFIDSL